MKRRIMLGIALLVLLVGAPLTIFAQESKSVWDLTESLKISDFGLNVKYPAGWIYEATNSNGIFLAETKEDIAALTDDDPATLATGSSIQLVGTKAENLAEALGDDSSIDNVANLIVSARGITENEARVDVPVMTRRSLAALGEDQAKQGWIVSVWSQGDSYMAAFLTSPSYDDTLRLAFSFGQLLGSITPLEFLPLGSKTIVFPKNNAQINYPDGWFLNPDRAGSAYELESDIKNQTSEGLRISTIEVALTDANLKADATLADLVDFLIANGGLTEPVQREEFILLGQPAVTIRGPITGGQYVVSTQTIIDGMIVQVSVLGADEAQVTAFEPTFIAMLQTLQVVKAS
jgi:hypothetical protein